VITVLGKLTAKTGKDALLEECAINLAKETREKEKGCLAYIPYLLVENPSTIIIFAQYADRPAYEAHTQTLHFKEALNKFPNFVEEKDNEILDGELVTHFYQKLI